MKKHCFILIFSICLVQLGANAQLLNGSAVLNNSSSDFYNINTESNCLRLKPLKHDAFNAQAQLAAMRNIIAKDPYVIKINNIKYYLVKNSPTNSYDITSIIGYDDTKNDLFTSLFELENDGDLTKITNKELLKSNIRLVPLLANGKLLLNDKTKDFNINQLAYIDMSNLRTSVNQGSIGAMGYFDVYIKQNGKLKKVIGQVTFETKEELKKML